MKLFAKATNEKNPIYFDEEAAKQAGYPALPAPPTYGFCANLMKSDPVAYLLDLGIDPERLLHAEQAFQYGTMFFAGDTLTISEKVTGNYEKKDGALEFIDWEVKAENQHGDMAFIAHMKGVIRHDV